MARPGTAPQFRGARNREIIMGYGALIRDMRLGRHLRGEQIAKAIGVSSTLLYKIERGDAPPLVESLHARLLDVLRATPEQREEAQRAWGRERVDRMTPRLISRPRASGATAAARMPSPAGAPEKAAEKAERTSEAKTVATSPNQSVFLGTAAEVLAEVTAMLGREFATRRVFVTVVVDNREAL
jgi:DNA-binding XRE family transcriptional regulator